MGVTVLAVCDPGAAAPTETSALLTVAPPLAAPGWVLRRLGRPSAPVPFIPLAAGLEGAERVARRLAPKRLVADSIRAGDRAAGVLPSCSVPVCCGAARAAGSGAQAGVAELAPEQLLRVPFAITADGAPLELDLKESAEGGHGPHGLVVGAVGSGKSELLRTLVSGLVATHGPDDVELAFADFKGGAHVQPPAAGPTLQRDDHEPRRRPHPRRSDEGRPDRRARAPSAAAAGGGSRRAEDRAVPRAAGGAPTSRRCRTWSWSSTSSASCSRLAPTCSTCSSPSAAPVAASACTSCSRASASRAGAPAASTATSGTGSACGRSPRRTVPPCSGRAPRPTCPPSPGTATCGPASGLVRFLAATVSATGRPAAPPRRCAGSRAARSAPPRRHLAPHRRRRTATSRCSSGRPAPPARTAAGRRCGCRRCPGPDRCPPLTLADARLDGPLPAPAAGLPVATGLVDLPAARRQTPLLLDPAALDGHLMVVGAPRTGKSTALAAYAVQAARRHPCSMLQFHVVDLGGGALGPLAAPPERRLVRGRPGPGRRPARRSASWSG